MTLEDLIEDERWGEWWCVQRDEGFGWRVVDASPDSRPCCISIGKSLIDAAFKALEKHTTERMK